MKIINGIILLFLSLNSYAQHVYSADKQNMYKSLVISDEYKIVQLSDSKIYLIKKQNHEGCQRLMNDNKPAFAWDIPVRKYIEPVSNADEGINKKLLNKLQYIMLTDEPLDKKKNITEIIETKKKEGNYFCEAIAMRYDTD